MNRLVFAVFACIVWLFSGCQSDANQQNSTSVSPDQLLLEIVDNHRFISTDKVADLIINEDPSTRLIDIRSPNEFTTFSLPGAINIPLENTLDPEQQEKLDCNKFNYIFYSNDDIHAEQAWILNRREGCNGCQILKGGLNKWVETIMQPPLPAATASSDALDLYQFRLAARRYFSGGSKAMKPEPFFTSTPRPATKKVKKAPPKKVKKEEEEEEGGC